MAHPKVFLRKVLWLLAGFIAGAGLSSTFANSREPVSIHFKVLAVSEEDASEKASLMLRDGSLSSEMKTDRLVAAFVPTCKEAGNDFACEARLTYRE